MLAKRLSWRGEGVCIFKVGREVQYKNLKVGGGAQPPPPFPPLILLDEISYSRVHKFVYCRKFLFCIKWLHAIKLSLPFFFFLPCP